MLIVARAVVVDLFVGPVCAKCFGERGGSTPLNHRSPVMLELFKGGRVMFFERFLNERTECPDQAGRRHAQVAPVTVRDDRAGPNVLDVNLTAVGRLLAELDREGGQVRAGFLTVTACELCEIAGSEADGLPQFVSYPGKKHRVDVVLSLGWLHLLQRPEGLGRLSRRPGPPADS